MGASSSASGLRPNQEYPFVLRVGQIKLPKWANSEYRNHMGSSFGNSYGQALAQGYFPGMPADAWQGLQAYLTDLATTLLQIPKLSMPQASQDAIRQAAATLLAGLNVPDGAITAILNGLSASSDSTGGHWNLEISIDGLRSALCPGVSQCPDADAIFNQISSAWNGFRDSSPTDSGHVKSTVIIDPAKGEVQGICSTWIASITTRASVISYCIPWLMSCSELWATA